MEYDLNINNYNTDELCSIFNISNLMDETTVIMKINSMTDIISQTNNKNYIKFITEAKHKIINTFKNNNAFNLNRKIYKNINNYDNFSSTDGSSHAIIDDKITPVKYTYEYKYPDSKLNPIERRTISKVVCFDTIFRKNYHTTKSNNVMWEMPYRLDNVVSMKLSSLQIPIQYYMFSAKNKNNIFNIKLYNMVDFPDTSIDVIIPDGNYSVSDFINCMNNYFTHVGGGLQYLYLDINTNTAHTIIRAKDINDIGYEKMHYPYAVGSTYYSPNFYFELTFCGDTAFYNSDLHLNAGWLMGFSKSRYKVTHENNYIANIGKSISLTNDAITYYAFLQSEMSYGTALSAYIFLQVNDFNSNSYNSITSYIHDGYIENNILAKCNVVCGFNSFLFDNAADGILKTREYFGPVSIEKLNVSLLDMNGKPLDLINNNYSFSLEFTMLYTN